MERIFSKSSYSNGEPISGNCVELSPSDTLSFHASRWSGGNGGNCVEVADSLDDRVVVRDSKDIEMPYVHVGSEAFTAFVGGLAVEEFARA
jgi:hypothetical protein